MGYEKGTRSKESDDDSKKKNYKERSKNRNEKQERKRGRSKERRLRDSSSSSTSGSTDTDSADQKQWNYNNRLPASNERKQTATKENSPIKEQKCDSRVQKRSYAKNLEKKHKKISNDSDSSYDSEGSERDIPSKTAASKDVRKMTPNKHQSDRKRYSSSVSLVGSDKLSTSHSSSKNQDKSSESTYGKDKLDQSKRTSDDIKISKSNLSEKPAAYQERYKSNKFVQAKFVASNKRKHRREDRKSSESSKSSSSSATREDSEDRKTKEENKSSGSNKDIQYYESTSKKPLKLEVKILKKLLLDPERIGKRSDNAKGKVNSDFSNRSEEQTNKAQGDFIIHQSPKSAMSPDLENNKRVKHLQDPLKQNVKNSQHQHTELNIKKREHSNSSSGESSHSFTDKSVNKTSAIIKRKKKKSIKEDLKMKKTKSSNKKFKKKRSRSTSSSSSSRSRSASSSSSTSSKSSSSASSNTSSSEESSKSSASDSVSKRRSKKKERERTRSRSSKKQRRRRSSTPRSKKIHIGHLTRNVKKAHLYEIFGHFGVIKNIDLPPDRNHPAESRGFGYIEFETSDAADSAVNHMNFGVVDGQTVYVKSVLQFRPQQRSAPMPRRPFIPWRRSPYRGRGVVSGRDRNRGRRSPYRPRVTHHRGRSRSPVYKRHARHRSSSSSR